MANASFHHIHFNVKNVEDTLSHYEKYYGATRLNYRNSNPALFSERSFFFLNELGKTPKTHEGSSLWHIGWSGVDGASEFNWRVKEGLEVHTPINPLKEDHWMYFFGPNKEVVEIFTGNKNHRFEHIHLLATDVDVTAQWFNENFGTHADYNKAQPWPNNLFKWNKLHIDNINIMINGKPSEARTWFPNEFIKTDGTAIDHIAFSFTSLDKAFENIKSLGTEIVQSIEIDEEYGYRHFYVRSPDGLLVEVIEEKPVPEGIWM